MAYYKIVNNTKGQVELFRRNITIINIKRKRKKVYINGGNESFVESLLRYIGQTITIFTISGGEAGSGFTGVLLNVSKDHIKLLTELGSPPYISSCGSLREEKEANISLGTSTDIPIDKIAAFVHNII